VATFEIPDGPTTAKVSGELGNPKAPRSGSAVFNVTNKSGERRAGRLSVQTAGEAKREWFTLDGEQERDFGAGETQTASIRISVPDDVAAGDYPFRLRVVAVNDPDNDHVDGPASTARIEARATNGGIKPWVWILLAVLLLLLVGGGLFFFLRGSGDDPQPPPKEEKPANLVQVPKLEGEPLDKARELAKDFDFIPVEGKPGEGRQPGTIYEQTPPAGEMLRKGFPVRATFDPGVLVPQLTGNTDNAVRQLSQIGLHVASSTSRCENTGDVGQILDQNPKPGARVTLKSGIDVVVRSRPTFTRFPCNFRMQGAVKQTVFRPAIPRPTR